jgi:2-phosphosulfolactate phosphatase
MSRPEELQVHLLPALASPEALRGGLVVVIDVLRATTTIMSALGAGCREVIPCLEIDEARETAARFPPGNVVLGGERDGVRIAGFDLGNSPAEYTPESVSGKVVVFTTTNGTRAMHLCRQAERVLMGAFVNLSAVCQAVAGHRSVHLLCAGTQGQVTREDALLAGSIADRLCGPGVDSPRINDQARLAIDAWRAAAITRTDATIDEELLASELRQSHGGGNLWAIGLRNDLLDVSRVDRFPLLGQLHLDRWTITAVHPTATAAPDGEPR